MASVSYLGNFSFGKNSNKSSAKFYMPLGKEQLLFFLPGPGFWKQLSPFHVSPAGMHLDGVSQTRPSLITTPSLGFLHQCPCWIPWPHAGSSSPLCQGRCSHQSQALTMVFPWVTQPPIASHQPPRAEYMSLENTKSRMRVERRIMEIQRMWSVYSCWGMGKNSQGEFSEGGVSGATLWRWIKFGQVEMEWGRRRILSFIKAFSKRFL